MLYWQYEKYIKSLCSFGEPLPPQAAKLPGAKMEAGENPARSRHCKEGAFFENEGISRAQYARYFPKATEGAADKPYMTLGKAGKRDERQVRRHAQMKHNPIHSTGVVQADIFSGKNLK